MIDDVRSTRRLDGLTRDQVVALLGDPANDKDAEMYKEVGGERSANLAYHLGPTRGYFRSTTDHDWLAIELDDYGKVRTTSVHTLRWAPE